MAVQARAEAQRLKAAAPTREEFIGEAVERANAELRRLLNPERGSIIVPLATEAGKIEVEILEPTLTLTRKLQLAFDEGVAVDALREADAKLDDWERLRRSRPNSVIDHDQAQREEDRNFSCLPFGVEMRMFLGVDRNLKAPNV